MKTSMKYCNIMNDIMSQSDLQRVYTYPIYSRDSKSYSDKGFVNIDNGQMGGAHWHVIFITIIQRSILIRSWELLINFHLINYQKQKVIINIKLKI